MIHAIFANALDMTDHAKDQPIWGSLAGDSYVRCACGEWFSFESLSLRNCLFVLNVGKAGYLFTYEHVCGESEYFIESSDEPIPVTSVEFNYVVGTEILYRKRFRKVVKVEQKDERWITVTFEDGGSLIEGKSHKESHIEPQEPVEESHIPAKITQLTEAVFEFSPRVYALMKLAELEARHTP